MNNMDHVLYGNFQSGSIAGGYCVGMESGGGGGGGMVMVGSGDGGGGGYQSEADHHHHHQRVVGYSSIINPADAGYDNNFLSGNSSVTVLSSDDAASSVVAVPRPSHHNHHQQQHQDMMTMMMQRGGSGGGNGMSHSTSISSNSEFHHHHHQEGSSATIRAKIASHALYPNLLHAYIDCQKLGAPPEIASFLDEIRRESVTDLSNSRRQPAVAATATSCLGADPELDQFMESYCELLVRYKMDLTKPFDEATNFLNHIESQFNSLCNPSSSSIATNISADEAVGSSDEDGSGGEVEAQDCSASSEDRELKDKLLRKYSGYISNLKHEFSKKKKKGKLPKESRQILLNWWNVHYNWPYPTEADKMALADSTGLDQKQINNWFINQRKRHWKPSENVQFAVVDSLYGPFFMND